MCDHGDPWLLLDCKLNKTPDSRRGRQFLPLILATARRAFQRKYALEMVLTEDVEVEERERERERESLVCQRCENGEVSWVKWNEKDKKLLRSVSSYFGNGRRKAPQFSFSFEAEAQLFLTLFASHLSRSRRSTSRCAVPGRCGGLGGCRKGAVKKILHQQPQEKKGGPFLFLWLLVHFFSPPPSAGIVG